MPAKISEFLDTSALFAGIWSATGGGRMILKLGEAGAIRLLVSPQVLDEIESALRRKAPDMLGLLALLLDRSGIEVVPAPMPEAVQDSQALTGHLGDAQVLAAAWATGADYFVTLDRKRFLDNPALREAVPSSSVSRAAFWLGIGDSSSECHKTSGLRKTNLTTSAFCCIMTASQ